MKRLTVEQIDILQKLFANMFDDFTDIDTQIKMRHMFKTIFGEKIGNAYYEQCFNYWFS